MGVVISAVTDSRGGSVKLHRPGFPSVLGRGAPLTCRSRQGRRLNKHASPDLLFHRAIAINAQLINKLQMNHLIRTEMKERTVGKKKKKKAVFVSFLLRDSNAPVPQGGSNVILTALKLQR